MRPSQSKLLLLPLALTVASSQLPTPVRAAPSETLRQLPGSAELANAETAWGQKQQRISEIAKLGTTRLEIPNVRYDVHLFGYRLNGSRRCGAVLVPGGPVSTAVVDLSDIRWDYPPRDISRGPYIATILAARAPEAAIILPCFRGMVLKVNDQLVEAEGDRSDAWEGATEDAMAFLTVAQQAFPRLPRSDITAYGYSRGGGVALLLGQRDRRVRRVLAFAAPTDFFSSMGRPDTDWPNELKKAQADPTFPADSRERQYIDWFFSGPFDVACTRHKLLMSSAAYFLHRLPPTEIHHGADDQPVPVANAELVKDWANRNPDKQVAVHIYEGEGHMIRDPVAFHRAREFLLGD